MNQLSQTMFKTLVVFLHTCARVQVVFEESLSGMNFFPHLILQLSHRNESSIKIDYGIPGGVLFLAILISTGDLTEKM